MVNMEDIKKLLDEYMLEPDIKNGKIIDGAGNPWHRADIGIKDGFITKIRSALNEDADKS
jgi:N-acyl-D-aspartate/D-glutamate deacylase